MKAINESITVEARSGVPCRFRWRQRTYRTRRLLDYWVLQSRWWGREERRVYFRIETDAGVMEVYRAAVLPSSACRRKEDATSAQAAPTREDVPRVQRPDAAGEPRGDRDAHTELRRTARRERPPLPMEGDTHTRERRRTDAVYRPDVRMAESRRPPSDAEAHGSPSGAAPRRPPSDPDSRWPRSSPDARQGEDAYRWMLSKIVD